MQRHSDRSQRVNSKYYSRYIDSAERLTFRVQSHRSRLVHPIPHRHPRLLRILALLLLHHFVRHTALFWFGVQTAYGGQCVTAILTAIWSSYANLANNLPASAGITSQGMLSFVLYWLVQLPFMLIPTHRLQYMFWAKTVPVLPTALAMVIWITTKAGNGGDFFNQPPTVHGSERA